MKLKSLLFMVAVILLHAGVCAAGSWHVEQDGSGDFVKLQPAVDAAASGDTIFIGPGWYQDYERVLIGFNWYRIMAFWDSPKDLVFVGAGSSTTTLGPTQYEFGIGVELFEGIKSYSSGSKISVRGVRFINFNRGVANLGNGDVEVTDCEFEGGKGGVSLDGGTNIVHDCSFVDLDFSVNAHNCDSVVISNCTIENALNYFGDTVQGIVRDCTILDGPVAQYFHSNGVVSGNVATCGEFEIAIAVTTASVVTIQDNHIDGGYANLYVAGGNTTVTATNNIFENPEYYNVMVKSEASLFGHGNDIYRGFYKQYIVKTEDYGPGTTAVIDMSRNHWGDQSSEGALAHRIYDSGEDPNIHITVEYMPIEGAPVPTESTNWGSIKLMYR